MSPEDSVLFETRSEWRRWLKANHDRAGEIWLTRYRKDSGKRCIALHDAVEEAICFGWIDGKLKKVDEECFIIRFSPRKDNSVWSLANKRKAQRMIKEGRMTPQGMEKIRAAKGSGAWQRAYKSSYVPDLPKDLERALRKDGVAWKNFTAFADTYRGGYIFWVASAKRQETREKRIAAVVERAREKKKPGLGD